MDLILSSDFTGTIDNVAYDGSVDAVQSFDAGDGILDRPIRVVITTGSVRLARVNA